MDEKKLRLGGMALSNGVLVHGPTSWACAVRAPTGTLKVASGTKPKIAVSPNVPLLRGPARLLEAILVLPRVRRELPEARFAFERRNVVAAMAAAGVASRAIRQSARLSPVAQELLGGVISLAPALIALRGGELAAYHGAEHLSIGTYEHGPGAEKEHERCGSHLVGPLILASAAGAGLAARVPERLRKPASLVASLGAFAASTEIFGWMVRHPDNQVAKVLAWPGTELQSRVATADPSPAQVEVAQAALDACLDRERAAAVPA
jgi:uncharacterized protein YqhQ